MNSQNLKASVSFVGDGTTNKFYFGFDYINKQFVKVQIGNEGQSLTYPSDYTVDDRSVVLKDTPAVGVAIRVYRETSSDRIVEWADGAFIKASQMTLENLQQLHLIEEAQDYPILNSLSTYPDGVNFNALGSRVINVSDPKDPQDVVTKHYMENVQNGFVSANTILVQEATKQASAAKSSASASATSATNAHNSEIAAANSAKQAAESAGVFQDFKGATADTDGNGGKVPKPLAGQQEKFLKADGTWGDAVTPKTLFDGMHYYPTNYVPADTSNIGWNQLGLCSIYYNQNKIKNQPTQFGQLINIPADSNAESMQFWIEQSAGRIYSRGGNRRNNVNNSSFKRFATTEDVNHVLERLGGNHTPVITDIFDRAGTIDMSSMSDSDKASAKANINKARNSIQDIWNTSFGIYAYGGGLGMQNGYPTGTIKLTQSYKDFDKILIKACNNKGNYIVSEVWDVWELSFLLSSSYRVSLFYNNDLYWFICGDTYQGTSTDYKLSTDTIWCHQDDNSGIVAIYGIKY